jgi:hypothetical protein
MLDADAPDPDPLAALVGLADEPVVAPQDPAMRRLLPDAYDDADAAAEFRGLTDAELRRGKSVALDRLAADLDGADAAIELTDDDADTWLSALNDIRLVLGVRLDIDDDAGQWRASLPPDDPRHPLLAAYDWLSMVQELILDAVT